MHNKQLFLKNFGIKKDGLSKDYNIAYVYTRKYVILNKSNVNIIYKERALLIMSKL